MVADSMMERQGVMPKVNIVDRSVSGNRVEVGWTPHGADVDGVCGTVQVGVTGGVLKEYPETDEHSAFTVNGWHATLDREQINFLIRTLRRVRDLAFGGDA